MVYAQLYIRLLASQANNQDYSSLRKIRPYYYSLYKGVSLRKTYQDTTKWFKSGPLTQNALWNRIEVRWNPDFRTSKRSGNWFENSGVQKRLKGGIGLHLFYNRIIL